MANCHNCERLGICPWASPEEIICSSFKAKPITNADRIRSMTDKELAVWLAGAMLYGEPLKVMRSADWEKWLKQESKEWNLT